MRLLREVVSQAVSSLIAHRFRAALTMLGISWGIVTVVLLMAYGTGFQRASCTAFAMRFPKARCWSVEGRRAFRQAESAQAAALC